MKKVMVCGCGAQGSTICRRLDEEPNIQEVVCADYNLASAEAVCKLMKKGTPKQVNAAHVEEIAKAAEGCELIVNVMPLEYGVNVMQAALQIKACYQDLSACENVVEGFPEYDTWLEGIRYMYTEYGKRFAANNTTAIIGTGSAPGVMCVVARKAVEPLDECDTIACFVYEGTRTKRFIPFFWSPEVALCDMEEDAYAFENCQHIRTKPFSRPVKRNWPECGREVKLVEHAHDEPVYIGFNREKYFKNCKNAYFKYGGSGIEFSEGLYRAGLLHHEPEEFNGHEIVPFDWVLKHIPNPPKDPEVIKDIIDEGIVEDNGAFVCEAYGTKDGKKIMVDLHLSAPGLEEAYARAKMTGEMYLTGQGAFLYTKLLVNDMVPQKGLISSDMLDDKQVEQYLAWAKELGITYDIEIKEGKVWEE